MLRCLSMRADVLGTVAVEKSNAREGHKSFDAEEADEEEIELEERRCSRCGPNRQIACPLRRGASSGCPSQSSSGHSAGRLISEKRDFHAFHVVEE